MSTSTGSDTAFVNVSATAPGQPEDASSGSTANELEILALTPPQFRLVLRERALPYRSFRLRGALAVQTTYYPGNPVATQQVIGSNEGDTTLDGMWKDRFVAAKNAAAGKVQAELNGDPVPSIADLVNEVDGLRRRGQQVRVKWGHIIREGLLINFEVNWLRAVDVEWKMEFAWSGQGEEAGPRAAPAASLNDAADEMHANNDDVSNNAKSLGIGNPNLTTSLPVNALQQGTQQLSDLYNLASDTIAAPTEFVRAVNGYIQNVYTAVDAMVGLVNQGLDAVQGVADAARKAASIFTYVKAQYLNLLHDIDARVSAYYYNVQPPPPAQPPHVAVPISSITSGQMTLSEVTARKLRRVARDGRYDAARQQARATAQAQPAEMLAVFVSKQDQDLRRISTLYYGAPTSWVDLAAYNGLTQSKLDAGRLIFVPRQLPSNSMRNFPSTAMGLVR